MACLLKRLGSPSSLVLYFNLKTPPALLFKFNFVPYNRAGRCVRTLLSPAFYCNTEWQRRLSDPTLSKVSADLLLTQLYLQFDKNGAATAVDMEVFANKIHDIHPTQLYLVESLFQRFRTSTQGISAIDSMSHAILRAYIELNQTTRLLPILQNKMQYGIFPDDFGFCLLLDHLIKNDSMSEAAKIATEMMLQGTPCHPVARVLALHACSVQLERSKDELLAPFTEDDKPTLDEEEDDYKVVRFIPLYNFDDHFDMTDEKRLMGKTLEYLSGDGSLPVYRTYKILGLAMYEKFDKLFNLLEEYLAGGVTFHKEALGLLDQSMQACRYKSETIEREPGTELKEDAEYNARHTIEERQQFIDRYEEMRPKLESSPLVESSLLADVKLLAEEGIREGEAAYVSDYQALMEKWSQQRAHNINLQERAFQLKERQEALDNKIQELTEKEELLNYFVRQNEISLGLLRGRKPKVEKEKVDDSEYVAEPGKRGKKR